MRVLIVDDEGIRHDLFRRSYAGHELIHAMNFDEARDALGGPRFDVVQLDHDLRDFRLVEDEQFGPVNTELTGLDVAKVIAAMPPEAAPGRVIVHSHNYPGAANIRGVLADAGIQVVLSPFSVG